MGRMKTTMEKNALCTKTYPLSTKTLSSNQRPTVPLSKHSSERNRQLLEAGDKLLCAEDSLHQKRVPSPEGLWPMDNPGWSRDTEKRASETIKHRAAEVVKRTVAERNHHRYQLNFLHYLSPHHRNFDGLSIIHSKNKENWDREVRRIDGCVSVCLSVYFLLFFFFKTAISNERFVFVCNKLIKLKFPDSRLLCPQQSPKQIKVPPCRLELSTWWL